MKSGTFPPGAFATDTENPPLGFETAVTLIISFGAATLANPKGLLGSLLSFGAIFLTDLEAPALFTTGFFMATLLIPVFFLPREKAGFLTLEAGGVAFFPPNEKAGFLEAVVLFAFFTGVAFFF